MARRRKCLGNGSENVPRSLPAEPAVAGFNQRLIGTAQSTLQYISTALWRTPHGAMALAYCT
jgi:hypothetical protein